MDSLLNQIFEILDKAYTHLENVAPKKKKVEKFSESIFDISPLDIAKFMEKNNIPSDAEFQGIEDGYDGYNDFVLSWYVEVPTNENDKLEYIKGRYEAYTYSRIYHLLTSEGYKRKNEYKKSNIKLYNIFETKNQAILKTWLNYKFQK